MTPSVSLALCVPIHLSNSRRASSPVFFAAPGKAVVQFRSPQRRGDGAPIGTALLRCHIDWQADQRDWLSTPGTPSARGEPARRRRFEHPIFAAEANGGLLRHALHRFASFVTSSLAPARHFFFD